MAENRDDFQTLNNPFLCDHDYAAPAANNFVPDHNVSNPFLNHVEPNIIRVPISEVLNESNYDVQSVDLTSVSDNPTIVRCSTPLDLNNDRNANSNTNAYDVSALVNLINNIAGNQSYGSKYDIRHIDQFSGDGNDVGVVSKLNTFLCDFTDFFEGRDVKESDKIILVKQKLTGSAKVLINSQRPRTFIDVCSTLTHSFGKVKTDDDTLLSQLKGMKLRSNENFNQYVIRIIEFSKTVAHKLECHVNDRIIFNAVSKALLSNFEHHIASNAGVVKARQSTNVYLLINELSQLIELDADVLVDNKDKVKKVSLVAKDSKDSSNSNNSDNVANNSGGASNLNPFSPNFVYNEPNHYSQVNCYSCGELGHISPNCPNMICGNCFQGGHTVLNCHANRVENNNAAPRNNSENNAENINRQSSSRGVYGNFRTRSDIANSLGITPETPHGFQRPFFRPNYNRRQFFRPRGRGQYYGQRFRNPNPSQYQ